jgi:hypothetical protein
LKVLCTPRGLEHYLSRFKGKELPEAQGAPRRKQAKPAQAGYMREVLEPRRAAGEIKLYVYEGVTLWLAPGVRYTPDFAAFRADGVLELHELKGYMRDDARL